MKRKGFAILLSVCLFCAAGCGVSEKKNENSTETASTENTVTEDSTEETTESAEEAAAPVATEAAPEMNFKDGDTRLISRNGTYIAVVGKCKTGDTVPFLTDSENENRTMEVTYGHLTDDWILVTSEEFPEEIADDDINIGVNIVGSDNLYPVSGTITKEEAKAIGLQVIDDHICIFGVDRKAYAERDGFYLICGFNFLDEEHGKRHEEIVDRLSFYAEDGTELKDCFEGYTMSVECPDLEYLSSTGVTLRFHNDAEQNNEEQREKNEEQNYQMCDRLKELNPYAVYTAPDGSSIVLKFWD